jgi:hypothetical protein
MRAIDGRNNGLRAPPNPKMCFLRRAFLIAAVFLYGNMILLETAIRALAKETQTMGAKKAILVVLFGATLSLTVAGCYVSAEPRPVYSSYSYAYYPLLYNGYVVYYSASGVPYYYVGARRYYIPRAYWGRYRRHYYRYRSHYWRWRRRYGYRYRGRRYRRGYFRRRYRRRRYHRRRSRGRSVRYRRRHY